MKKEPAPRKTIQTQTYPLRALPNSKTEAEVAQLGAAPVLVSATVKSMGKEVVPDSPPLLQSNALLDEDRLHPIAKLAVPEASSVLESPNTQLLGTSVSRNISLKIKPAEVSHFSVNESRTPKTSRRDLSEISRLSTTKDMSLSDQKSPNIDINVPAVQEPSDSDSLKYYGFTVANTSRAFPEISAVKSVMKTIPIIDLAEPDTSTTPDRVQQTNLVMQPEDALSVAPTETLLVSVDFTADKASSSSNKLIPIPSVRFYANTNIDKTKSSKRDALLTSSLFGASSQLRSKKSTNIKLAEIASTDKVDTDQSLTYTSATNSDLQSDTNADLSSVSIELFETSPESFPPKWSPKLHGENDNIFKAAISKQQLQREAAEQSYLESKKFFGSLGSSSIGRSSPLESALPIRRTERLYSILKNRPDSYNNYQIEAALSHAIPATDSALSSSSTYTAVSSLRRFSNPFMTVRRPNEPASTSDGDLHLSGKNPRGTPRKAHFAGEQNGTPEIEEIDAIFPWCGKCRCFFRCCQNFSLYDPVCNKDCCFPYVQVFWIITLVLGFLAIWVSLAAIWDKRAWPGGDIFQFYTMAVSSYATGWLFACMNIPPSIGMFATGLLFRNLDWFHPTSAIAKNTRSIVVAFILLRAGLNTEFSIFKTQSGLISRMAFIPGLSEMMAASLCAIFLLDFTWEWALLFGCVVAPLSPLAIIYPLVRLREDGYGEDKGISSMLLMIYALDNVTLVTLFGIFFTITFDIKFEDATAIYLLVLQSFAAIFGGIGAGLFVGTVITFFPHRYDPYCSVWRTILLSCSGLGAVLFSHTVNYDGVGYIFTIVMAFTASVGWKALGTANYTNPVSVTYAMIWHVLQPIALSLIGAEVHIYTIDTNHSTASFTILPTCMMTRFIMAFLMSCKAGFNYKERLFIALLSLTKGTPQAVLAPMAFELSQNAKQKHFAKQLLNTCILEILITLPLGPLIASFAGPRLLKRLPITEDSTSSNSPFQESCDYPSRHRYKSIASRITTNQEFMLYPATGVQPETGTYYE